MIRLLISVVLVLISAKLNARSITQLRLDDYLIQTIPVAIDKGNTTIMFPGPVSGLYASKVSPVAVTNADFLIDFTPGKNYFCIRALKENAEDVLTAIFEQKAYVLKLKASSNPYYVASFYRSQEFSEKALSPAKLISLLDKAKAYQLLVKHQPDAIEGVSYYLPSKTIAYTNFNVFLKEVWRFEEQDTLVFHLELENPTKKEIRYQDFAARVGDQIYFQSVSDASGIMPSNSVTQAYFAITGNAKGGRNYLSVTNDWSILVVRKEL
jgi:hypothetical protein